MTSGTTIVHNPNHRTSERLWLEIERFVNAITLIITKPRRVLELLETLQ